LHKYHILFIGDPPLESHRHVTVRILEKMSWRREPAAAFFVVLTGYDQMAGRPLDSLQEFVIMNSKNKYLGLALAFAIVTSAMAADDTGGVVGSPFNDNDAMIARQVDRNHETVGAERTPGTTTPSQRASEPGVSDPDKITGDEKSGRVNDENVGH
jgi:hypothetical protein